MQFCSENVIRRGLHSSKGLHLLIIMMVVMILLGASCGRPEGPSLTMVEPEPAMTAESTVAPSPSSVQQATPQETPGAVESWSFYRAEGSGDNGAN